MHLEALTGPDLNLTSAPLPLAAATPVCTVRLRSLPGASSVHLVVREEDAVRLRAEVPVRSGEVVTVHLELDAEGTVHAWSPEVPVLTLPVEDRWSPLAPIRPASDGRAFDLALVIDGTLRAYRKDPERGRVPVPLFLERALWEPHVERLVDFESALLDGCDGRVAVVAFGDEQTSKVSAQSLTPHYHLYPVEPAFGSMAPERVLDELLALPPTPGGDFVDALADALDACRHLGWRPEARKILVIAGSSPGASLLHPVRKGGDARARERDVDCESLALHEKGVELATLFYEPEGSGLGESDFERELLDHARAQYRRLASLHEWAWSTPRFDPQVAAASVRESRPVLGRESTWGELLTVTPSA